MLNIVYCSLGAILSATDSVCTLQVLNQEEAHLLYNLVFGEGEVNDATSVVLFNAIQRFDASQISSRILLQFTGDFLYLFILSTLLGITVGLLSAYMMKTLCFGRHSTEREVALMVLMAYFSFIIAESCLTTPGIILLQSQVTAKRGLATLSFVSEISLFLYVGMDALDTKKWISVSTSPWKSIGVSLILLGLILVGRAASVFPLSCLSNLPKKYDRIGFKQQVTIWWAGLIQGAVSVLHLRTVSLLRVEQTSSFGKSIIVMIVLFSTVVFGLLTKTFVRLMVLPQQQAIINQ